MARSPKALAALVRRRSIDGAVVSAGTRRSRTASPTTSTSRFGRDDVDDALGQGITVGDHPDGEGRVPFEDLG